MQYLIRIAFALAVSLALAANTAFAQQIIPPIPETAPAKPAQPTQPGISSTPSAPNASAPSASSPAPPAAPAAPAPPASPANASSASPATHTVDMTTVLMDEVGRPAKDAFGAGEDDKSCTKCPPLTLGAAISHALLARYTDERDLLPEQVWARGVLAQRIKADPHAQLTAEEVALIKRLLPKYYGGVVVLQAFPLLDPNAKPPEVK